MMAIQIPGEDFPALVSIAKLDEPSFTELKDALVQTPPTIIRRKYVRQVAERVKSIKPAQLLVILNVIRSIMATGTHENIQPSEVAEAVLQAALESREFASYFSGEGGAALKKRIEALLSIETSAALSLKGADLITEYERVFCHARILTDVRPIFLRSTASVSAAVIVHNLQIGFYSGVGNHQEIYIALDDDDLIELGSAIERAQEKAETLRKTLRTSKITEIDI